MAGGVTGLRCLFDDPCPLFAKQSVQLSVIQFIQSASGQYHSIYTVQLVLMMAKSFTQYTLDSVTLYRETDMFFGNYKAKTGRAVNDNSSIGTGEN